MLFTDPMLWRPEDVKAWVSFTLRTFNLQMVPEEYFAMDGPALVALTEEDFNHRAPEVSYTTINLNVIVDEINKLTPGAMQNTNLINIK